MYRHGNAATGVLAIVVVGVGIFIRATIQYVGPALAELSAPASLRGRGGRHPWREREMSY